MSHQHIWSPTSVTNIDVTMVKIDLLISTEIITLKNDAIYTVLKRIKQIGHLTRYTDMTLANFTKY